MYHNLEAELKRRGITRKILAEALNMSINTVSTKLNKKTNFTIEEAFAIKDFLGVQMPIDSLFESVDAKAG